MFETGRKKCRKFVEDAAEGETTDSLRGVVSGMILGSDPFVSG